MKPEEDLNSLEDAADLGGTNAMKTLATSPNTDTAGGNSSNQVTSNTSRWSFVPSTQKQPVQFNGSFTSLGANAGAMIGGVPGAAVGAAAGLGIDTIRWWWEKEEQKREYARKVREKQITMLRESMANLTTPGYMTYEEYLKRKKARYDSAMDKYLKILQATRSALAMSSNLKALRAQGDLRKDYTI